MTKITSTQARAIVEAECDILPHQELTDAGMASVKAFVATFVKGPESGNLRAWYSAAEKAIAESSPGETAILEARRFETVSGNPETLRLYEGSDWVWVIEDVVKEYTDGEITIQADLEQASAPVRYKAGDQWIATPYQTADGGHRENELLELVSNWLKDN